MSYSFGALECPIDLGDDFSLVGVSPCGGVRWNNHVGQDSLGDYVAATNQQRNKVEEYEATFRAINPDGATAPIVLGGNTGYGDGFIATRVDVSQRNEDDGTVRIRFHKHDNNGNLHGEREVEVTIPLTGYGVLAAPLTGSAVPDNMIGMDWSAEVGHIDRTNKLGDHLVGFSFGCRIECSQEYIDDAGSITPAANWHIDGDIPAEVNTDARTRRVNGHTFDTLG